MTIFLYYNKRSYDVRLLGGTQTPCKTPKLLRSRHQGVSHPKGLPPSLSLSGVSCVPPFPLPRLLRNKESSYPWTFDNVLLRSVPSLRTLFILLPLLRCVLRGRELDRKRQARAFHRMLTGLQIAQNNRAFMRFMTLTSIKYPKRELKDGFDVLRLRIQRARIERDGFHGFKFNRYFCIRTSEGNGVLHIVFWGRFIPQKWLSSQWKDINGAHRADIRKVWDEKRRVGGLVGYLITNYLTEQPIERMSYGWRWAWLGFCKSWKRVQETYGDLRRWRLPYKQGAAATWHDKYKDCSWEAWWQFLYGERITSVQKKLVKREKADLDLNPKVVYGLPTKRLKWVLQSTLFGYNHGFT